VPSATAILDRFLHHAEIIRIAGKGYRLRQQERSAGSQGNGLGQRGNSEMKKSLSVSVGLVAVMAFGTPSCSRPRDASQAEPEESGHVPSLWSMDPKSLAFPNRPAAGLIHGLPFRVEQAKLEQHGVPILTLRQGKDFFADREVVLFLWGQKRETIRAGYTAVTVGPGPSRGTRPGVHISWMESGRPVPTIETFTEKYALKLELGPGQAASDRLPAKIHLSLPDPLHSYVAGIFTVEAPGLQNAQGR
jgi:IstB-like ATP binding protein